MFGNNDNNIAPHQTSEPRSITAVLGCVRREKPATRDPRLKAYNVDCVRC